MTEYSSNNKRIVKNTLLLYIRMMFTMAVALFTSRVVLNALGISDFGIYNVVGGFIAMFTVLSGSFSNAITRFITFELGKKDSQRCKYSVDNVCGNCYCGRNYRSVVFELSHEYS